MSSVTMNPPVVPRNVFARMPGDEPVFTGAALVLALLLIPLGLAMAIDARQFQFESVWVKPTKFAFALTLYLGTLAFYARWLPPALRDSRPYRVYSWVVVAAITAEMLWIGGAAAFGTASHFNTSSPVMTALYGVMGLLAVTLTTASAVYGWAIWRNRASGLGDGMRTALALGLLLTLPLTLLVAGVMSSQAGHLVGEAVTQARVPLMGWSMEVGDLRVPHFLATHAMHVVPLVALGLRASPRMAVLVAAGFTALTLATFAQALMGLPLIPA